MLQLASAASAEVGAFGRCPLRSGMDDIENFACGEILFALCDLILDSVANCREGNKDDQAFLPDDALSAKGHA